MKHFMILLTLLISSQIKAAPECDYHFQLNNYLVMVSENQQVVQQDMSLWRGQNSPDGRCGIYRIFFSQGQANSYQRKAYGPNGAFINYNLHRLVNQNGILKDINDALNSNERLQGTAPNKNTIYSDNFFVSTPSISAQNFPVAGTYTDTIQISIYGYNENSGNYNFEETKPFTLSFVIPQRLFLSLIDEGGAYDPNSTSKTLDFGNLTLTQEKGVDLRVVSNTPYQVRVSSTNAGKLKHTRGPTIPYVFKINSAAINLATSDTTPVTIGSGGLTSTAGQLYNIKVGIIGVEASKMAGLYQDSITITAIAN